MTQHQSQSNRAMRLVRHVASNIKLQANRYSLRDAPQRTDLGVTNHWRLKMACSLIARAFLEVRVA